MLALCCGPSVVSVTVVGSGSTGVSDVSVHVVADPGFGVGHTGFSKESGDSMYLDWICGVNDCRPGHVNNRDSRNTHNDHSY